MNNNMDVILHGEAMIFKSEIPQNAHRIDVNTDRGYHIIANSETTGNHHVIDSTKNVEFFMDNNGVMYMNAKEDTTVECVHVDRHNPIKLPAGTYEFGTQQEYDHFAKRLSNVSD